MGYREVLPPEFLAPLEEVEQVCVQVLPQWGEKLVKLSSQKPISEVHLKICRKLEGHLQVLVSAEVLPELAEFLEPGTFEVLRVKVPKNPPMTLKQAQEWSRLWPLKYHKPAFQPVPLSPTEIQAFNQCFQEMESQGCQLFSAAGEKVGPQFGILKKDPQVLFHPVMQAINALTGRGQEGYYLTGLTCLVKVEPCLMCAMALLHSRVSRVIFQETLPKGGISGSYVQLQLMDEVNHRFRVYQQTD